MTALDKTDARSMVEAAYQVGEMTKHPGWAALNEYAHLMVMAPMKKRVLNDGNIVDLAEYKKLAGYLGGIHRVLDMPEEIEKFAASAKKAEKRERDEPDAA